MIGKMIYRIKQFWFAMFSRYTQTDKDFAYHYLNIAEMSLFQQLPDFEKKHAVVVAQKMLALTKGQAYDERKIARLGLLHDIGKIGERNSVLSKSLLVMLRFFWPGIYESLAQAGHNDPRWRRFYVHKHHGAIGAELLAKIGESSEILSIIKKHDPRVEPFGPEDPVELKILQQADSTY